MKNIKDAEQRVKKIKLIIGVVLCGAFLLALLFHSEKVRGKLILLQAEMTSDSKKKIELYTESLGAADDLDIRKKLIEAYTMEGDYEIAGSMTETLLREYPDDSWLLQFQAAHTPPVPLASALAGTYEEDLVLSFSVEGMSEDDGTEIFCRKNGESVEFRNGETSLVLSENGSWQISLYTRNNFGFQSESVEYTYVIDKIIPKPVKAKTASGYFCEPIEVELEQPEGYPIYYTIDGSAPTSASILYNGPITIESGRMNLRTAACSPVGTMGEESGYYYHIRPWSSGMESLGTGLITAQRDYFCQNGMLGVYEDGAFQSLGVSIGSSCVLCEHEDGILIAEGTSMQLWNPFTEETTAFGNAPGSVTCMMNAGGKLYLVARQQLYCWEDGQAEPLAEGLQVNVFCVSQDGQTLFTGSADGIYTLFLPDLSLNKLVETGYVTSIAFGNNRLFYCVNSESVYSYDVQSGEASVIEERKSDFSHIDPYVEPGRLVSGSESSSTTVFDKVCFANDRVYYHYTYNGERSQIPWINWNARVDTEYFSASGWKCYEESVTALVEEEWLLIGNGYCWAPNADVVIKQ